MSEAPDRPIVTGTSESPDPLRDTSSQRFDGEICDGLHDEGAPAHHLCSRCFLYPQGDLAEPDDAEYRHDEEEEMA